ncbi:hypothetical protein Nm8I071_40320 [Nonomuraea sp. TT08I-71]|nr:hypothetical protein Nm8I071_40320 [Nonomuraea sp. TT08I-71]
MQAARDSSPELWIAGEPAGSGAVRGRPGCWRTSRHRGPVVLRAQLSPSGQTWPVLKGDTAAARMPTPAERRELEIGEGIPVIVIFRADGSREVYAADRTASAADPVVIVDETRRGEPGTSCCE